MNAKKNYLYNMIYNILGIIIPLITAPYLSRILGTEGIGIYSYYYAIAYYFTLLGKMGLTNYGTRRIAEVKNDEDLLKRTFTSIYLMQILVASIVAILYFIMVNLCFSNSKEVGLVFGIWIVGTIINIDWFLFGLERFKETATRNIIVKLASLIMIFVIVKEPTDVWKYALIFSVGSVISYIILWDFGKKYFFIGKIDKKEILSHIKPCMILMIPVIALNIYRSLDKVMLGRLSDMNQTGLYENAEKIIYSLTLFISSLGTVMMPRMAVLISTGKKDKVKQGIENSLLFVTFMTSAMCFGVLSVSNSLIPWFYGKDFIGSIELINLLAITLVLIGWGNVIRTQYIIPTRMDDIYIKSVSLGAIVNIILNCILIPRYQAIGACIGTIFAEITVPLYQGIRLRKSLPQKRYICKCIPFVVFGLIMFIVLKALEKIFGTGFFVMIIQILLGALIYLGLSYVYIKLYLPDILDIIKRKKN